MLRSFPYTKTAGTIAGSIFFTVLGPFSDPSILVCVIVEVSLNVNERGSLVAGAAGQVTQ